MTVAFDTVRQTEEHLLNAWPSLRTVVSDGWVLREARGYTKRANSASALAARGAFEPIIDAATAFYASYGHPTIFRLTPLAGPEPDRMLADRGYDRVDETIVMTAPLDCTRKADDCVTIDTHYSPEWEAGHASAHRLDNAQRRAHRAILEKIVPLATAYAVVRDGGQDIAFGLGVIERGRLGLFDIVTMPSARRQGAAHKLVGALLSWGARNNAGGAWLSVIADNSVAIALYEQFGFRELYRYHYRISARSPSAMRRNGLETRKPRA